MDIELKLLSLFSDICYYQKEYRFQNSYNFFSKELEESVEDIQEAIENLERQGSISLSSDNVITVKKLEVVL